MDRMNIAIRFSRIVAIDITILCLLSCSIVNWNTIYEGDVIKHSYSKEEARYLMIEDFSKHFSETFRDFIIIEITHQDSVFRSAPKLGIENTKFNEKSLIRGEAVFWFTPVDDTDGPKTLQDFMPNKFFWYQGHLFVWREGEGINEYLLRIYKDKNLLFASPEELWEQRINDLWPYVGYFYLKENPFKLKRIVQSLGQSPVPDLTL